MTIDFSLDAARRDRALAARRLALPAAIESVFATPWPASVGTLELNNALTALRLRGAGVEVDVIARDYADVVNTGAELFCAWPQAELVAYAGRRRMHLVDLSGDAPAVRSYFLTGLMDELVRGFAALAVQGRRYLALLGRLDAHDAPLRLVTLDLGGGEPEALGELTIAQTASVQPCEDAIVVYDAHEVRVLDHRLQPRTHALLDALARLAEPRLLDADGPTIEELVLHPALPLAFVVARDGGDALLWLLSWHDPLRPLAQRITRAPELASLALSPDGDWLRFYAYSPGAGGSGLYAARIVPARLGLSVRDEDGEEHPAVAVDPLLHLARDAAAAELMSLSWTHGPTGIVACDRVALDYWELPAEA